MLGLSQVSNKTIQIATVEQIGNVSNVGVEIEPIDELVGIPMPPQKDSLS